MNVQRSLSFYSMMFNTHVGIGVLSSIYVVIFVIGIAYGILTKTQGFAYVNLLLISFIVGSRLDQFDRSPMSLLTPNYRFEQVITNLAIIGVLGGLPLLLTANGIEQLLFLLGLTVLTIGILLSVHLLSSLWAFLSTVLLFTNYKMNSLSSFNAIAITTTEMITAGSVLIGLYSYLKISPSEQKLPSQNLWMGSTSNTAESDFHFLRVFIPNIGGTFLQMSKGIVNFPYFFIILFMSVFMIELSIQFSDSGQLNPLASNFWIYMVIGIMPLLVSFSGIERLWMATNFKSKSGLLIQVALIQTSYFFILATAAVLYIAVRTNTLNTDLFTIFAHQWEIALLLACGCLCRLNGFAFFGALLLSLLLGLFLDPLWEFLLVFILWLFCIYYYAYYTLEQHGKLVAPVLMPKYDS